MMTRTAVLLILVVLTVGGAYWLSLDNASPGAAEEHRWLNEFSAQASSVNSVTVSNAQGVLFAATQINGDWMATHVDANQAFPVNRQALGELVSTLRQTSVVEPKTASAEYYPRLGVEPLSSADAQGTLVELGTGKQEWAVIVGNTATNGMGQYVREQQADTSYLIDASVPLPSSATDWLISDVLSFGAAEVAEIEITHTDNRKITLARNDDDMAAPWRWQQQPRNRTLTYPGVLAQSVADIVDMRYAGVAPYIQEEWEQRALLGNVRITLKSGSEVVAYLAEADEAGAYRLWISTPDNPQWISDWVFELSDFQAAPFRLTADDLLQSEDE